MKNKSILVLIFLWLLSGQLWGQLILKDRVAGTVTSDVRYLTFAVNPIQKVNRNKRLAIRSAIIDNGDLKIRLELYPFPKPEIKFSKKLAILSKIVVENGPTFYSATGKLEMDYKENRQRKRQNIFDLTWENFTEKYRFFEDQPFELVVEGKRTTFNYPCDQKVPRFLDDPESSEKTAFKYYAKKQWGHLAGLVLGGGLIWLGESQENLADDFYEDYRRAIFLEDARTADQAISNARSKADFAHFFKVTGYSMIAIDAVIWGVRYYVFERRKRYRRHYCQGQAISLLPKFDYTPTQQGASIQLAWTF